MGFSFYFEFYLGKYKLFTYKEQKVYYFLFPALIRQNSAEWKAHDLYIISKIEVQHLKK